MSGYMDTNAKPCDDFYLYACGNFLKNNKIPDHKYRLNTGFEKMADNVKSQVKTISIDTFALPVESGVGRACARGGADAI